LGEKRGTKGEVPSSHGQPRERKNMGKEEARWYCLFQGSSKEGLDE